MPVPMPPKAPPKQSARELVYHTMLDWITNGVLAPGEKINDQELSRYFSLSRTPIREAMQLLANQQLIEIFPGKESRVAEIDPDKSSQVYEMLAGLHGLAVRFAYPKLNDVMIQELEAIIAEGEALGRDISREQMRENDLKFHDVFIHIADNAFLKEFTDMLYIHVMRIENIFYDKKEDYEVSLQEHRKILDAVKAEDLEAAVCAVKENWMSGFDVVIRKMKRG